jgi:hypothetical protein
MKLFFGRIRKSQRTNRICCEFFHSTVGSNKPTSVTGISSNILQETLNFQIWGSSTAQVCHIAKEYHFQNATTKTLSAEVVDDRVSNRFVKKGFIKMKIKFGYN